MEHIWIVHTMLVKRLKKKYQAQPSDMESIEQLTPAGVLPLSLLYIDNKH